MGRTAILVLTAVVTLFFGLLSWVITSGLMLMLSSEAAPTNFECRPGEVYTIKECP